MQPHFTTHTHNDLLPVGGEHRGLAVHLAVQLRFSLTCSLIRGCAALHSDRKNTAAERKTGSRENTYAVTRLEHLNFQKSVSFSYGVYELWV